tara:strand:- start:253 stop:366 length:114 start_codon:yes stop_codon:yes gene_type:complete
MKKKKTIDDDDDGIVTGILRPLNARYEHYNEQYIDQP